MGPLFTNLPFSKREKSGGGTNLELMNHKWRQGTEHTSSKTIIDAQVRQFLTSPPAWARWKYYQRYKMNKARGLKSSVNCVSD